MSGEARGFKELTLIEEGSRREVKGIATLDDVAQAVEMLFDSVVPVGAPFHCYLDGTSFAIWTEAKCGDDGV